MVRFFQVSALATAFCLISGCQLKQDQIQPQPNISYDVDGNSHLVSNALYLRGGFNGWGSVTPFHHVEGSTYESKIKIAPGNHEFKIATIDWKKQWVIKQDTKVPAHLDQNYTLVAGGSGSFLFVKKTSDYLFRIDNKNPLAPILTIRKLESKKAAEKDPHVGMRIDALVEFATWDSRKEQVKISIPFPDKKYRRYTHSTTQSLRDPDPQFVRYKEQVDYPRVRSGNLHFDALFALALSEMKLNSVEEIHDGNYQQGQAIPCECFETGAKWHYVWTRDLAYAADLGLSVFDPQRVRNSLEFKLSAFREGVALPASLSRFSDAEQIVQDTGTGGSWPVSTDRVAWAFGAARVLDYLGDGDRSRFVQRAYSALKNTVQIDRIAAFDKNDGLYRGEQSFLDWREQSYAAWVVDDIARLASAKALSTNIAHYQALALLTQLSQELGKTNDAEKYASWSARLKTAINQKFWLATEGTYSSLTASHFDNSTLKKYDLLGIALAIKTGVANSTQARSALSHYPHGPMGAPVIFPQQPDVPIYHNRAIWPFVTAYALQAAKDSAHSEVADEAYRTLIRGASLNLSNMENLEWLSAQPVLLDDSAPRLSGPVINSKRQLWSVAGYLGMVVNAVFGIQQTQKGVIIQPFITSGLRREYFADSRSIALLDLKLKQKNFDVRIFLPPATKAQGYYPVETILLNGVEVSQEIPEKSLRASNTLVIQLGSFKEDQQKVRRVNGSPYASRDPNLFAPHAPQLVTNSDNALGVRVLDTDKDLRRYTLTENGKVKARDTKLDFLSRKVNRDGNNCYSVSVAYPVSNNHSHHSQPTCFGKDRSIFVNDQRVDTNKPITTDDTSGFEPFIKDWGLPTDRFKVNSIAIDEAGKYAFQLRYRNHYNQINLGITNGVKWLIAYDAYNQEVARAVVQMPHVKADAQNAAWALSTPLTVILKKGIYRLEIHDFFNMSYFASNALFTGMGGTDGPINRFDMCGVKILALPQ